METSEKLEILGLGAEVGNFAFWLAMHRKMSDKEEAGQIKEEIQQSLKEISSLLLPRIKEEKFQQVLKGVIGVREEEFQNLLQLQIAFLEKVLAGELKKGDEGTIGEGLIEKVFLKGMEVLPEQK